MDQLNVKLDDGAKLPTRATTYSAGLDLYANSSRTIIAGTRALIDTGCAVAFDAPGAYYHHVLPRSGLAVRGIDIGAGVIDADYRGTIRVLLINNSANDFEVKVGDRIAQLVTVPIVMLTPRRVETLDETSRGSRGFGSTERAEKKD